MLSVDAVQFKLICDEEIAVAVRPAGTDGAVESPVGGGVVEYITVTIGLSAINEDWTLPPSCRFAVASA